MTIRINETGDTMERFTMADALDLARRLTECFNDLFFDGEAPAHYWVDGAADQQVCYDTATMRPIMAQFWAIDDSQQPFITILE